MLPIWNSCKKILEEKIALHIFQTIDSSSIYYNVRRLANRALIMLLVRNSRVRFKWKHIFFMVVNVAVFALIFDVQKRGDYVIFCTNTLK